MRVNQVVFLEDGSFESKLKKAEKEASKSLDYVNDLMSDFLYEEFPEINSLDYPKLSIKKIKGHQMGYFQTNQSVFYEEAEIAIDQEQIACAILDQELTGSSWGWLLIEEIIKHECIHFGLWFNGEDWHDEDPSFLKLLDKYGLNDNASKLNNPKKVYMFFDGYTLKTFTGNYTNGFQKHTLSVSKRYPFINMERTTYMLLRCDLNVESPEIIEPVIKLKTIESQKCAQHFLDIQPKFANLSKDSVLISA